MLFKNRLKAAKIDHNLAMVPKKYYLKDCYNGIMYFKTRRSHKSLVIYLAMQF